MKDADGMAMLLLSSTLSCGDAGRQGVQHTDLAAPQTYSHGVEQVKKKTWSRTSEGKKNDFFSANVAQNHCLVS